MTIGNLAKRNIGMQSIAGTAESTSEVRYIAVTSICPRFQNKYINNLDKSQPLKESIAKVGLIEPIKVIPIDKYVSYLSTAQGNHEEELTYLNDMSSKGIKYFITSGHRRFKAYISITLDKDIASDTQWAEEYENLKKTCEETEKKAFQAILNCEEEPKEKWITIPCIVEEENFAEEATYYNDTNTTQRELTGFEIIVNSIDEMKKSGYWEEMCKNIVSTRVESMTNRKVTEKVNDLTKEGVLERSTTKRSPEEERELLKGVDYKLIPGTEGMVNNGIVKYIKDNKQREVTASNVDKSRAVLDTFSNEMLQTIYDGFLTFKVAKELVGVYNDIDEQATIKEIKEGTFKLEAVKKKSGNVAFTNRQLIDLIYDIRDGKITANKAVKMIEANMQK